MSENKSSTVSNIMRIVVPIAIIALVAFGVISIQNSLNSALSPLKQTNSDLSTQVSNILHPTPTVIPDPVTIINEVRALARLETIQYTVEKVITVEVNQGVLGPLIGDRILFVGHGVVIAGIDMAKMNAEDMWLTDSVLNVRLPKADILVCTLDNTESYVYDRETGILTHGVVTLETTARQAAEQEICIAALEDGILDMAQQNAELFLEKFFESLGYKDAVFVH
jgi:hypothetical protein